MRATIEYAAKGVYYICLGNDLIAQAERGDTELTDEDLKIIAQAMADGLNRFLDDAETAKRFRLSD